MSFSNFTQETCTGTGDTLTLTGATLKRIAFVKSFGDADPVTYVLVDSGGSIRAAGIGTYNSPANTITRNDSWNFNGTVIDDSPASNIVLSNGNHTISCDLFNDTLLDMLADITVNTAKVSTDTTSVTAAGALMDSEVDADLKTLVLPANTTISSFGASLVDDAAAVNARATLELILGVDVQVFDADILKSDVTDDLTVGYTTNVEVLGSVTTITPDMQTEWLKSATITGNLTVNESADGEEGGCVINLTIDSSGPYTITVGTGVLPIPSTGLVDLEASASYEMKVVKHANTQMTVEVARFA